jgi:serine/threonine protein phosphatase PrpC
LIRADEGHLAFAAASHPGETGKNNEDRYAVASFRIDTSGKSSMVALVADGIGGHQAGEVASRLAVDTAMQSLATSSALDPVRQLRAAVVEAGRAVSRAAQEAAEREGMGSTLAAVWVIGDRLYTATVGDSRIYWLRRGHLHQVSTDHTWVQEAIDHGIITPDEARSHPNVHVLRRHLGGQQVPEPDLRLRLDPEESEGRSLANQGARLSAHDQILLCSDGLTDLVENHEIRSALLEKAPQEAVAALVDLARQRGGHDNITVVVLAVPPEAVRGRRGGWGRVLIAAFLASVALLALVGLALLAAWWLGWGPVQGRIPTPTPSPADKALLPLIVALNARGRGPGPHHAPPAD